MESDRHVRDTAVLHPCKRTTHEEDMNHDTRAHPCLGGRLNEAANFELIDGMVNLSFTGQLLAAVKRLPDGYALRRSRSTGRQER